MMDYLSGIPVARCTKCKGMVGGQADIKTCRFCLLRGKPEYVNITKVLSEENMAILYDISSFLWAMTFDIIDNVSNDWVLFRSGGKRAWLLSEFWRIKKWQWEKAIMEIAWTRSVLPHSIYSRPQAYALIMQLWDTSDLPS